LNALQNGDCREFPAPFAGNSGLYPLCPVEKLLSPNSVKHPSAPA
jgi:hypothetical protein